MVAGNGKAHALEYFFIERPKLGMRLSFEQDREKREGPFLVGEEVVSTLYKQRLNIATRGWVYHPALLEYSLEFSPEWNQSRENLPEDSVRTAETFLAGYEAELRFLQYKPYSLTLYGKRKSSTRRNNFAGKSFIVDDLVSAQFNLKYTGFNSSFKVLQRESEQTGVFDFDEDEKRSELTINHNYKFSSTILKSIYRDLSTRTSANLLNTNSLITTLNNRLKVKNSTLNSRIKHEETDQSLLRLRHFSFDESLNIDHRPNLRSRYHLLYEEYNEFDKVLGRKRPSDRSAIGFNLYHLLYENLTTNVQANIDERNSRTGREIFTSAGVDWEYRRYIPVGTLTLIAGYDYAISDTKVKEEADVAVLVQNEPITLTDGVITYLANQRVIEGTIRVTQLTSFNGFGIPYLEGIDYDVLFIGSRVQIIRIPGGAIANGQTVFAEYRYNPVTPFDYSLISQNYGIRFYLWSSLDIYYRLVRAKQNFLSGTLPVDFDLLDDSIHMAGTEYKWKWSKTTFEWEDRYSKNTPLEKWTATELMRFRPRYNTFFSLSASYGETKFKETDVTQKIISTNSAVNWLLSDNSQLRVNGSWSRRTSITQYVTNTKITSRYQWQFRVWKLNIEYLFKNLRNKDDEQEFTSHEFLVELIRELF